MKPDLVILNVFLDNDVADCDHRLRYSDAGVPFGSAVDGKLRIDTSRAEQSYADYHREPARTLRANSATYRMTRDRWQRMSAVQGGVSGVAPDAVPRRYKLYQTPAQPHWDAAWATLEQTLNEFAAEVKRQQAKLLIVSLPAGQVVSKESWKAVQERNPGMASATFDLDGPEQRLAGLAQKHGWPLLLTVPACRQAGTDRPLFFGDNGHFTPNGHELMMGILADHLDRLGLLPPG